MSLAQLKPYIGGQAVLEGVMMRSPKSFVVAVRRADGQIAVREQDWETLWAKVRPLSWPILRGGRVLIESLWNGLAALNFSAEQALPEGAAAHEAHAPTRKERIALAGTLVVSLGLGLALFVGAPHLLTWLLGVVTGMALDVSGFAFHAIDGLFKGLIFLGYLLIIGRFPEIQRVFGFHGAEHKAIWTYEKGEPLTPENAARQTALHPRCGTSFILLVLVISIVLNAAILPFIPKISSVGLLNNLAMIVLKLPLMIPIAGIAYELQRLSARERVPLPIRLLVAPGLWLQKLTTREPDRAQLEVALVALARALSREEQTSTAAQGVTVYRGFDEAVAA